MAHPYRGKDQSSASQKFAKMGLPASQAKHTDTSNKAQVEKRTAGYARGGRTPTSVNIVIQPSGQQGAPAPRPGMPPIPPPAPMAAAGGQQGNNPLAALAGALGGNQAGGLLGPAGAAPPGQAMQPPMPMMRAHGGRVSKAKYISGLASTNNLKQWAGKVRSNSYHAKGGRVKMTAGADTGEGRLEKSGKKK